MRPRTACGEHENRRLTYNGEDGVADRICSGNRPNPVAAGLLAFFGAEPPASHLRSALDRAPWRGWVTDQHRTPYGSIYALGSAQLFRESRVSVVAHGRIDNGDVLARRLGADAENLGSILISAYLHHGDEFGRQLVGDFALVLLDEQRQMALGVKDWVGARPLFWGQYQGSTAFASEVKQVLALLGRPFVVNEEALSLYEQMLDVPPDLTFARDVQAVLPSGQMAVRDGAEPRSWQTPLRFAPIDVSPQEAAAETRRLLEQAVMRRTSGARSLGALVSGGMDSTSVAATAAYLGATHGGPPLRHAYTLSFPEYPECDETHYASRVATRWDVCPVPVVIEPEMIPCLYQAEIELHDGPPFPGLGHPVLFAQAQAHGTDVLLTGQMADFPLEQRGSDLMLSVMRRHWHDAWLWSVLYARRRPRSVAKEWARAVRRMARGDRAERLFERRYAGYKGRPPLELEERMAMRYGMRAEAPFADEELSRFLAGIPSGARSDPHERRTKAVVRKAMEGILPDEVRLRRGKPTFDAIHAAALKSDARPILPVATQRLAAIFRELHQGDTLAPDAPIGVEGWAMR